MQKIYFDESGNTGENLLDKDQPYFILTSCDLSDEAASQILGTIFTVQNNEKHFSKLKKSKKHQESILEIISNHSVLDNHVSITIIDKKFMITCQIVDVLIESTLHELGYDLYRFGENLAMANMLHYCFPGFYGERFISDMYTAFCNMIKVKDIDSIQKFYNICYNIRKSKKKDYLPEIFDSIHASSFFIEDILNCNVSPLEPAIPSLFAHAVYWGKKYPTGFSIIHDTSKPIASTINFFNKFMDNKLHTKNFGYDRRQFQLPLKARSISMKDSKLTPQIQVADIFSGSAYHWSTHDNNDEFAKNIGQCDIMRFINANCSILPSTSITPEELGTNNRVGCNPVNSLPSYLSGKN